MYVSKDEIEGAIMFPKGSIIAVVGDRLDEVKRGLKSYIITDRIAQETRFAIIEQNEDSALFAYKASKNNIPYCIVGSAPESVLLTDVLWKETHPFIPSFPLPNFLVKYGESKKEELLFQIRFVFALAEKITQDILLNGESEIVFLQNIDKTNFYSENRQEVYNLLKGLKGRVDGLKQAENALILLKIKEKSTFEHFDCLVLLAKYLAKVYNCFIKEMPFSLFAPDNVMRQEIVQEFFGVKSPKVRKEQSEYEIRKRFYMIRQNYDFLSYLWERVDSIISNCYKQALALCSNHGFGIEEHSEDIKFSMFIAPDILDGESLLSFIKDCGVGDNFI